MSKSAEYALLQAACLIGLLGVLQYVGVTTWLMEIYPGGNLLDRGSTDGYSFTHNFLSDLGRTTVFRRGPNPTATGYMLSLAAAGISTMIFFAGLCHFLWKFHRTPLIILCLICGIGAGAGYVGIALHPINVDYRGHIRYVQLGFIAFWWMTVFCAACIFQNKRFHNNYARILLGFALVLGVQIVIMLFGPRSWSSGEALLLQVIAQKVVVYSEILSMTVLIGGTMVTIRRYYREEDALAEEGD
ncbi:MAG: hypothetical protein R3301_01360 [Saprospiraceae bacterium]|nr:hypothetical protein [Saprospiraceae bacterium]